MKRSVVWSENARQNIREIASYIAADNIEAARRVAATIRKTGDNLGKLATGHPGRMENVYERNVADLPYTIAYSIDPSPGGREVIHILHIIHHARNWTENKWPD